MKKTILLPALLCLLGCMDTSGGGSRSTPASDPAAAEAVGFYRQGETAMKAKPPDLDSAIQYFTLALQSAPYYPQALFNRGRANAKLGKTTRSEADFDRAVAVAGEDKAAFYHFMRARFYHDTKDLARAESSYNQAMEWEDRRPDPYLVDVLMHRALLYVDTRRPELAVADYQRILQLDPDANTQQQVVEMMSDALNGAAGSR